MHLYPVRPGRTSPLPTRPTVSRHRLSTALRTPPVPASCTESFLPPGTDTPCRTGWFRALEANTLAAARRDARRPRSGTGCNEPGALGNCSPGGARTRFWWPPAAPKSSGAAGVAGLAGVGRGPAGPGPHGGRAGGWSRPPLQPCPRGEAAARGEAGGRTRPHRTGVAAAPRTRTRPQAAATRFRGAGADPGLGRPSGSGAGSGPVVGVLDVVGLVALVSAPANARHRLRLLRGRPALSLPAQPCSLSYASRMVAGTRPRSFTS